MLENNCSEQASRMSAMESSTKNAKEMLERLTLSYNRHGFMLSHPLSFAKYVERTILSHCPAQCLGKVGMHF